MFATSKHSIVRRSLRWDAKYRDTAIIALLWAMAVASAFARPLMPIDETRYVSVAWEMWQAHSAWLPLMNGEPYADKPPLLFWLIHVGWGLFGVNEWWPRLISPLAALLAMAHLYRIARRLGYAGTQARLAPMVLMSMLMWNLYAGALMFDVLLTACLLGTVAPLVKGQLNRRRALSVALWLGLSLLAKGPAVFVTLGPILMTMPWWRSTPLGARGRRRLGLALVGGVVVLACWALTAAHLGGESYARMLLWGQSVERLHESIAHARPVWWYLPWLALLVFPWSFWPAAWPRPPRWRYQRLAWCWTLIPLALFSLISGKQIHYLMPLLPGIALLIMDRLGGLASDTHRTNAQRLPLVVAAIILLGVLGLILPLFGPGVLDQSTLSPAGALALIGWGLLVWRWQAPSHRAAACGMALASGIAVLLAAQMMLAPLWARYDISRPGELIHHLQLDGVPVAFDGGGYQATFQFAGRLTHPLSALGTPQAICDFQRRHPDAWLVAQDSDWQHAGLDRHAVHTFDYRGGRLDVFPLAAISIVERLRICGVPPAGPDTAHHRLNVTTRGTP